MDNYFSKSSSFCIIEFGNAITYFHNVKVRNRANEGSPLKVGYRFESPAIFKSNLFDSNQEEFLIAELRRFVQKPVGGHKKRI